MAVDTRLLYPAFRTKVEAMLADLKADGYSFMLSAGFRRPEEQDALFAQGRTKPGAIVTRARAGQSSHNFGIAVDFLHLVNGKADWTESSYTVLGRYADKHGLSWGGRWKTFKDLPHVEFDIAAIDLTLPDLAPILAKDGMPAVWKLLDAALKG